VSHACRLAVVGQCRIAWFSDGHINQRWYVLRGARKGAGTRRIAAREGVHVLWTLAALNRCHSSRRWPGISRHVSRLRKGDSQVECRRSGRAAGPDSRLWESPSHDLSRTIPTSRWRAPPDLAVTVALAALRSSPSRGVTAHVAGGDKLEPDYQWMGNADRSMLLRRSHPILVYFGHTRGAT
jgi:hypothetical protein